MNEFEEFVMRVDDFIRDKMGNDLALLRLMADSEVKGVRPDILEIVEKMQGRCDDILESIREFMGGRVEEIYEQLLKGVK